MNHKLTLFALLCALAWCAACTSETKDPVVATAPPAAPASPATPPKPVAKPEVAPSVPTLSKLAPEIVGEDIDGKPMKLSDYRGKVVMLDFWGHW